VGGEEVADDFVVEFGGDCGEVVFGLGRIVDFEVDFRRCGGCARHFG